MLSSIKFQLFNSSKRYGDKLMLWAAMLTAFFGFLRVSEYTSTFVSSYDPNSTLCYEDVVFKDAHIHINIKASKTDPFQAGSIIRLAPNSSPTCPVKALKLYMRAHHSKTGPLFSFQGGKYLTRKDISNVLHEFLPHNTKGISSHSFRIGAASAAASAGYPRWLIQSLGRWSSDCFRSYIRIPDSTIDSVSTSMVKQFDKVTLYDPDVSVNC